MFQAQKEHYSNTAMLGLPCKALLGVEKDDIGPKIAYIYDVSI